jgi:hypothetical protein
MSHNSMYVTNSGIDVKFDPVLMKDVLVNKQDLEYVLTPDDHPVGYGKTVTPKATTHMITEQIYDNVLEIVTRKENAGKSEQEIKAIIVAEFSDENKPIATEFGKESLLRLLSQEGCIGIRFTTCKNYDGKRSIVAVGLVEDKNTAGDKIAVPLKKGYYMDPKLGERGTPTAVFAPLSEEEGIGSTTKKVLEDMGKNLETFVNEIKLGEPNSIRDFSKKVTTHFFGFQ